jgi:putative ABC transport system ATP-binding protein
VPLSEPAAVCEGLVRIYRADSGEVHALRGIDAAFPSGAVSAVVGPSGSGKSSLLRILAGLDRATAGSVRVGGTELAGLSLRELRRLRRRRVGYVYQRPSHNLIPYLTVREHVEHAAALRRTDRAGALDLLERLGLGDRAGNLPPQLSGGEQQRLALAQAVAGRPALLVADEPTAELDHAAGAALLELLRETADHGTAVVLSTHDAEAVEVADRTIALRHGSVEAERVGTHALSVIDAGGRVQLPPEVLRRFPDRRAVIEVRADGVIVRPPDRAGSADEGGAS